MNMSTRRTIPVAAALLLPLSSMAAVLNVGSSQPYATIGAALDASQDGDEIVVDADTYEISATLVVTNAVHLHSRDGRGVTTVGPARDVKTRIFFVKNAGARLSGFTIQGGNNSATTAGAGVRLEAGLVDDCIIENCGTSSGAGAYVGAGATISNCVVRGNTSSVKSSHGAGAYVAGLITHCVVTNNSHSSTYYGSSSGGIYLGGAGSCVRTVVAHNSIATGGTAAGVYFYSSGILADCLIVNNSGGNSYGAAVCLARTASGTVLNCTIARNTVGIGRPDYVKQNSSGAKFANCLIQENQQDIVLSDYYRSTMFTNCSCSSAYPDFLTTDPADLNSWVETVEFTDADGGDYSLVKGFAINGGSDEMYLEVYGLADFAGQLDIAGNPRKSMYAIDVGAHEKHVAAVSGAILFTTERELLGETTHLAAQAFVDDPYTVEYRIGWGDGTTNGWQTGTMFSHDYATYGTKTISLALRIGEVVFGPFTEEHLVSPNVIYVSTETAGVTPTYPFGSPETATSNIVAAVAAAWNGSEIRVAKGTYEIESPVRVDRAVQVYSTDGRDVTTVRAVPGVKTRIFEVLHADARLSGLTVSGGDNSTTTAGAGMRLEAGLVDDCIIEKCGTSTGAGAYVGAGATISNCVLRANTSTVKSSSGAGAYVDGRMTDCVVTNNNHTSSYYGSTAGGIHLGGAGRCVRTVVAHNSIAAGATAAGVYFSSSGVLADCLIMNNTGGNDASAGVCLVGTASGTVLNCTIARNRVGIGMPPFVTSNSSGAKFVNCLIQENQNQKDIVLSDYYKSTMFITCISSNDYPAYLTTPPEDLGSLVDTVAFKNPEHEDYRLLPCAAVNGGTNALYLAAFNAVDFKGLVDLDGNPRLRMQRIDVGSYEREGGETIFMLR